MIPQASASGSDTNAAYATLFTATTTHLQGLRRGLLDTLGAFGANQSDPRVFSDRVLNLAREVQQSPPGSPLLGQMRLSGIAPGPESQRRLFEEMLRGLAVGDDAPGLAKLLLSCWETGAVALDPLGRPAFAPRFFGAREVTGRLTLAHRRARALVGRLERLLSQPRRYGGTAQDPARGLAQSLELLADFPDIADSVYQEAGLHGVTGVPPRAIGTPDAKTQELIADGEAWHRRMRRREIICTAGLIAVGIAASVVTGAALGPLAAMLVSTGIALSQGGTRVTMASRDLQRAKDAQLYDAASTKTVAVREGELTAAYAGAVLGAVSLGISARVGGNVALSQAARSIRLTAIGSGEGALGSAVNPNTWRSGNAATVILTGAAIGAVGGASGGALVAGAHVVKAVGGRIHVALGTAKGRGPSVGDAAVVTAEGSSPARGTVTRIDPEGGRITVDTPKGETTVQVRSADGVDWDMFDPRTAPRRPVTEADFPEKAAGNQIAVWRTDGNPDAPSDVLGRSHVWRDPDGAHYFGTKPQPLDAFEVPDFDGLAKAFGPHVRSSDLKALWKDWAVREYRMRPLQTRRGGYFVGTSRGDDNPRLIVLAGKSQDGNGAFKGLTGHAPTPSVIRDKVKVAGRNGRAPRPEELAVFNAHGSPRGFQNLSTRDAARLTVDAVINTNRASSSSSLSPIRYVMLESCSQGNRRFILFGKTNAQAFQREVDARLREMGIDPRGPGGLTVLASDKPGLLYSLGQVQTWKNQKTDTTFVPARDQNSLRYPGLVARQALQADLHVDVALLGGPAAVVGVLVYDVMTPEGTFARPAIDAVGRRLNQVVGAIIERRE